MITDCAYTGDLCDIGDPDGKIYVPHCIESETFADPVFDRLTRLYTESAGFRAGTWDGKNTRCPC